MLLADLSWLFSGKDYWYATVSAFIGSGLGIWWAQSREKKSRSLKLERDKGLLLDAIDFNLERLDQIGGYIANQSILPNFPLDPATLSKRIDPLIDEYSEGLISSLVWQRFQLEHLNNKLNLIHAGSTATATGHIVPPDRLADLVAHAARTHQDLTDIRSRLSGGDP